MSDNVEDLSRRRAIESLIEQVYAAPAGPRRNALVARLAAEEAKPARTACELERDASSRRRTATGANRLPPIS